MFFIGELVFGQRQPVTGVTSTELFIVLLSKRGPRELFQE